MFVAGCMYCSRVNSPLPLTFARGFRLLFALQTQGYVYHALSCFCEWLLAFSFLVYFSTMVFELRDYCLDPVKVSGFSDDMSHR